MSQVPTPDYLTPVLSAHVQLTRGVPQGEILESLQRTFPWLGATGAAAALQGALAGREAAALVNQAEGVGTLGSAVPAVAAAGQGLVDVLIEFRGGPAGQRRTQYRTYRDAISADMALADLQELLNRVAEYFAEEYGGTSGGATATVVGVF